MQEILLIAFFILRNMSLATHCKRRAFCVRVAFRCSPVKGSAAQARGALLRVKSRKKKRICEKQKAVL